MADSASSISVCVRVRPFTVREAAQLSHNIDGPLFLGDGSLAAAPTPKLVTKGIRNVIKVMDDRCLVFDPPEDNPVQRFSRSVVPNGKRAKDQTFGFDRVFDENVTQGDVYEATTRGLLDSVFDGYNATVFAYGATGCGKTHTITGTIQQPGIIFLTMNELFGKISERQDKVTEITLSYLEIYNETIRDLLLPGGSKGGLMLREDSNQTCSVAGLTSHRPQNVEEVMEMIVRGNEYRTMSPTEANATSSRSHAVLQINVTQKDCNADINEPHTMATLSIIDLAGSERASATKNRGDRLIEGANINKSLLALGSCINALCDPRKKNHIPYRNSKLTRLLKFSLGGNCKTVMIVCVSPSSAHFDETQNTLRYANRAKNIRTKVTRNVFNVNRHVKDFLVKIDEQRAMIDDLMKQQKEYEAIAFDKFRKQNERRENLFREGIARIRNAFDCSATERTEKANSAKRLRQIERRVSMLSIWIHAFDHVCGSRDDETGLQNLRALRKSAQGILVELESSRHHYRQKLANSNCERALDSALQNSIRQLKELEGSSEGAEMANLTREAELLKSNAERDVLNAVAEQEKATDGSAVQVLLQAQFETIAEIGGLLGMNAEEAIPAAKKILNDILRSTTTSTSNVVKPDASIAPVELFPPTRAGTPKRKKQVYLAAVSPMRITSAPVLPPPAPLGLSPLRVSPKRRKLGGAKKGVSFTPKRKSPTKLPKRGVRWRDDTEDGALADFEKTPKRADESSDASVNTPIDLPAPRTAVLPPLKADSTEQVDSSPILPPSSTSLDSTKPKHDRFKTGFLSKKTRSSPQPPTITAFSSDSDHSPLRDLEPARASNRSSLYQVQSVSSDVTPTDSDNNSSSDVEDHWTAAKNDVYKVKDAIKRASIGGHSTAGLAIRSQRRRSPVGASSASPPNENTLFSSSHARRMVKCDKESLSSVLGPRTAPIVKVSSTRRTTMTSDSRGRDSTGGIRDGTGRPTSVIWGSGGLRGSLVPSKGIWK